MEYLPCGDMAPYTSKNKFLGESTLQSVTRQLLHALNYCHRNGIVHRDIKPENILIKNQNPFFVKLSDFGLSKMIDKDDPGVLLTFCGTLLYCAPEIYPDFEQMRQGLPRIKRNKRYVYKFPNDAD
jgi:serine/threonine protein kinase